MQNYPFYDEALALTKKLVSIPSMNNSDGGERAVAEDVYKRQAPTYISTADIALPCELQIDTAVRNGNNINFFRIFQQICLFKDRIIQQDFLIANLMAVDIKCLEIHICTPQVMFRLHKRP